MANKKKVALHVWAALLISVLCLFQGGCVQNSRRVVIDGLLYETYSGLDYYSVSCYDETVTNAVVLSEVEGLPVTTVSYFWNLPKLESVVLPETITYIAAAVFEGCNGLKELTLPKGYTEYQCIFDDYISENAQQYGTFRFVSIEKIYYTGSLSDYCKLNFQYFDYTTGITGAGLYFEGVLLTDFVTPDDITALNDFHFYGYRYLKSVTLGEGFTAMGDSAFAYASAIGKLTISQSLTKIGAYAFFCCPNIKEINYLGTKEQWGAVEKGEKWDYDRVADENGAETDVRRSYTVHCSDGDVFVAAE